MRASSETLFPKAKLEHEYVCQLDLILNYSGKKAIQTLKVKFQLPLPSR